MYHWCTEATMAKVNTACNGNPGLLGCTNHMLICTELLVISISNITFGYRRGCGAQSSCPGDRRCCREETDDCFTPYNQTLLSQLQQTCNGGSSCTLNRDNGLEEISSYCFNGNPRYNSYNKIEYQCVSSAPSSTPRPSAVYTSPLTASTNFSSNTMTTVVTTITSNQASVSLTNIQDTNAGAIVGGVVGVIIVIAIVGVVIFFIKRRQTDKNTPKNVHVNQNGSTRRYQTDATPPRTTATPVYYELEKSSNTSNPNNSKPTSGDNYVKHSAGKDNYNHIGINDVTSDDEYHHLKEPNSNTPSVPNCNYNHIGSFSSAEDNYQHIGDNKSRIVTEDTYNHIDGHDNTGLDSDDYHHIGGSQEHQAVTDGTYNHIGSDHNDIMGNDDYHHIGNGNTQPIITDGEYSHIGGAGM